MTARLRIAYVYRDFTRGGSIGAHFVRLAETLAEHDDVTAVCSARTRDATTAPLSFETVEPLVRGKGRLSYALECRSFAARATRALARQRDRFDVIHVEGFASYKADLVTVHAVRRAELEHHFDHIEPKARIRRRISPYLLRPQGAAVMSIEQRLFAGRPLCVCVSKQVKRDLERVHGIDADLIDVIPIEVDVSQFRRSPAARGALRAERGVPDDRLVALFVGDDFHRKGLETAISALAGADAATELWVVGHGAPERYRAHAASLGVAERVHFVGPRGNRQLPPWYSAADVLLLPSRQDGWGIPVIEAMAAGCVAVMSEYTGAHEIVEEGRNGYVLSGAGEAGELAALLNGPLRDADTRAVVGAAAVETAAAFDVKLLQPRWSDAAHRAHELRLERLGRVQRTSGRNPVTLPSPSPSAPLVEVVTPVYNGEAYLVECIESVLAQTYTNWRYLIVDNASTDETSQIAEEYARRDKRVRLIRYQEYRDVIPNWNRALQLLSPDSRYCKMLLADDWLFPECVERMVAVAEQHPSAGIVGSYRIYGDQVDLDALPASVGLISGREICRRSLLGGRYIFGSPSNILFRADLVRARAPEFFDEAKLDGQPAMRARAPYVNYHADTEACYDLLRESDFGFVPQVLTFTRLHKESITSHWTRDVNTWLPGHLYTLLKYGPVYLSSGELREQVRAYRRRYDIYLLKMALKGRIWRDGTFRAYHRGALDRLRPTFREVALRPGLALILLASLF
jgi:glycosyltransferase involved in cell wall biosynthesis